MDWTAGVVSVCQAFECQRARNYDIPPRTPQEGRAIVIRLFFEHRHHVDETLERVESEKSRRRVWSLAMLQHFWEVRMKSYSRAPA